VKNLLEVLSIFNLTIKESMMKKIEMTEEILAAKKEFWPKLGRDCC
jgi:hypothetical protein